MRIGAEHCLRKRYQCPIWKFENITHQFEIDNVFFVEKEYVNHLKTSKQTYVCIAASEIQSVG
jgi:hypothetical protein